MAQKTPYASTNVLMRSCRLVMMMIVNLYSALRNKPLYKNTRIACNGYSLHYQRMGWALRHPRWRRTINESKSNDRACSRVACFLAHFSRLSHATWRAAAELNRRGAVSEPWTVRSAEYVQLKNRQMFETILIELLCGFVVNLQIHIGLNRWSLSIHQG